MVVNLLCEIWIVAKSLKVVNLLYDFLLESLPRIIVFQSTFSHLQNYLGEVVAELKESLFREDSHCAVVLALNGCSSRSGIQDGHLSEVFSLLELPHKTISSQMVDNPDRALSLCNKEQALSLLALANDPIFWHIEKSGYIVNQKVDGLLAPCQDRITCY